MFLLLSISDCKDSTCSAGDPGSIPGLGRSLEKGIATHSSILAWRVHGQKNLVVYSLWGHKELGITERPVVLSYLVRDSEPEIELTAS